MRVVGIELNDGGYVKEWDLGNTAEIIPRLYGGNATQYKCDVHFPAIEPGLMAPTFGGDASFGSNAGLGFFNSLNNVDDAYGDLGFRSSCVIA